MSRVSALTVIAAVFFTLAPSPVRDAQASTSCLPASVRATLNGIRRQFGSVRVISTFRPGARISGSGRPSYHASCQAVDFHPPRGQYRAVLAYIKRNHQGGVGTYSCGMHHIHIDSGPYVRWHKCVRR